MPINFKANLILCNWRRNRLSGNVSSLKPPKHESLDILENHVFIFVCVKKKRTGYLVIENWPL